MRREREGERGRKREGEEGRRQEVREGGREEGGKIIFRANLRTCHWLVTRIRMSVGLW